MAEHEDLFYEVMWRAWTSLLPWGPSSFQRHDRAGRYEPDRQLTHLTDLYRLCRATVLILADQGG